MKVNFLNIFAYTVNILLEKETAIADETIMTLEKGTDTIATMTGGRTKKEEDTETATSTVLCYVFSFSHVYHCSPLDVSSVLYVFELQNLFWCTQNNIFLGDPNHVSWLSVMYMLKVSAVSRVCARCSLDVPTSNFA